MPDNRHILCAAADRVSHEGSLRSKLPASMPASHFVGPQRRDHAIALQVQALLHNQLGWQRRIPDRQSRR